MHRTPDQEVRVQALAGVIVLCSWARHFILTVSLSTQEYKWVSANCHGNLTKCWGVAWGDGPTSHPEGVAILLVTSCFMLQNRDKYQQLHEQLFKRKFKLEIWSSRPVMIVPYHFGSFFPSKIKYLKFCM